MSPDIVFLRMFHSVSLIIGKHINTEKGGDEWWLGVDYASD